MIDSLFLSEATTPWFDPSYGGLIGGFGGAALGIFGGVLGTLCGILIPQGKGRAFLLGSFRFLTVLGFAFLAFGSTAVLAGQPFGIYYPGLLLGLIATSLGISLRRVVRRRYEEVEARRLEAESLRRG